jgi:hypothetical protein
VNDILDLDGRVLRGDQKSLIGVIDDSLFNYIVVRLTVFRSVVLHVHPKLVLVSDNP